jgi:hypothetical protein
LRLRQSNALGTDAVGKRSGDGHGGDGWLLGAGLRTIRRVPSDLSRGDIREEGNLLIEAVSLLVQRQGETEGWVTEQIWLAEERAAAAERRYSELEARLADLEEQLERLAQDIEPAHGDASIDERLARLREQVEGLKSAADGRLARSGTGPVITAPAQSAQAAPEADVSRPVRVPEPRYEERAAGRPPRAASTPQGAGFWELLGPSPQARYGFVLIGAGSVAVVYALLSVIRF